MSQAPDSNRQVSRPLGSSEVRPEDQDKGDPSLALADTESLGPLMTSEELAGVRDHQNFPWSKHTTISEDRTVGSGWNKKRLAVVLPHTVGPKEDPTSFADLGPIPETSVITACGGFHGMEDPDILENFDFDTFLNAGNDSGTLAVNPASDSHRQESMTEEEARNPSRSTIHRRGRDYFPVNPRNGKRSTSSPRALPEDSTCKKQKAGEHSCSVSVPGADRFLDTSLDTASKDGGEMEDDGRQGVNFSGASNDDAAANAESCERYQQLKAHIETLEQENNLLKSWVDPDAINQGQPFCQVVYRFSGDDKIFFKPPSWTQDRFGDGSRYTLSRNSLSMKNTEYLQRSSNLAFVIFKTYTSRSVDLLPEGNDRRAQMPPLPEPESETVLFACQAMKLAMQTYLYKHSSFAHIFPYFTVEYEISSPYLFWYHTRASYESVLPTLYPTQRALVKLFGDWINFHYDAEYTNVSGQIARGVISCRSMKYLIRPGDPLVSQEPGALQAYQATSFAKVKLFNQDDNAHRNTPGFDKVWEVPVWSYEFDGVFYQKEAWLEIELDVVDPDQEVALHSLSVTLLQYASVEVKEKLMRRGTTYWACRRKKFVSYTSGDEFDSFHNNSERFMIDYPTYKALHPSDEKPLGTNRTAIPPERMDDDTPPIAPEIYFFPPRTIGFNLRRKKWVDLEVDLIEEVEWNKNAFESLAKTPKSSSKPSSQTDS